MGIGLAAAAIGAAATVGTAVYSAEKREDAAEERQKAMEAAQARQRKRAAERKQQQERAFNSANKKAPARPERGRGGGVKSTLLTNKDGVKEVTLGNKSLLGD